MYQLQLVSILEEAIRGKTASSKKRSGGRHDATRLRRTKKLCSVDQFTRLKLEKLLSALLDRIEVKSGCIFMCEKRDQLIASIGLNQADPEFVKGEEHALFNGKAFIQQNRFIQPLVYKGDVVGYLMLRMPRYQCNEVLRELVSAYGQIVIKELELGSKKNTLDKFSSELVEKKRELERTQKYNSNILSITTHDLSSPLNAINGYLELVHEYLLQLDDPGRLLGYHAKIYSGIQDITDMLEQLSEISRIERGLKEVDLVKTNIQWVVNQVREMLVEEARQKEQELIFHEPDFHAVAMVDLVKLKRVFYNLISNAIKYTGKGGKIEIMLKSQDGEVQIIIADTGTGIDPTQFETIFKPFKKLHTSEEDLISSSGLGLFVADYFIKLMDGQIHVDSQPGKGSRFIVCVPEHIQTVTE